MGDLKSALALKTPRKRLFILFQMQRPYLLFLPPSPRLRLWRSFRVNLWQVKLLTVSATRTYSLSVAACRCARKVIMHRLVRIAHPVSLAWMPLLRPFESFHFSANMLGSQSYLI